MDREQVAALLSAAGSDDQFTRTPAEQTLRSLERSWGFFDALVAVSDPTLVQDENLRLMAATYGKNATRRVWRALSPDSAARVKQALLDCVLAGCETSSLVALHRALWIAAVARVDRISAWPNLLMDLSRALLEALARRDICLQHHLLAVIRYSLKELASMRLAKNKAHLAELVPNLFNVVHAVWNFALGLQHNTTQSPHYALLTLAHKCINTLLRSEALRIDETLPAVAQFFETLLARHDLFATQQLAIYPELVQLAVKSSCIAQAVHPIPFLRTRFLSRYFRAYLAALVVYDRTTFPDKYACRLAEFAQSVLTCPEYEPAAMNSADVQLRNATMADNFGDLACSELLRSLLTRVLILTEDEVSLWADDPEDLVREEDAAEWNPDNPRTVGERLVVAILTTKKSTMGPHLLELTQTASTTPDSALLMDACYRAIGRCAFLLDEYIDFPQWFSGQLAPILSRTGEKDLATQILKARACKLVGQFVDEATCHLRPTLYGSLLPLMEPDIKQLVVNLASVRAVHTLVDHIDFDPNELMPFVDKCLGCTFGLATMVQEADTKQGLLTFAGVLFEGLPPHVLKPHIDSIAREFGPLLASAAPDGQTTSDDSSGAGNIVRGSAIVLATKMVECLGPAATENEVWMSSVLGLIGYGTDRTPVTGGAIYLMDDCLADAPRLLNFSSLRWAVVGPALDLWVAVVRATQTVTEPLARICQRLGTICDTDFDQLHSVLRLVEGYVLLSPVDFLREYGSAVSDLCTSGLDNVRDRGMVAIAETLDLLLSASPPEALVCLQRPLKKSLELVLEDRAAGIVQRSLVVVLSRLSFKNYDCFAQLIGTEEHVRMFLDRAIHLWDVIYLPSQKHLVLLGMLNNLVRVPTSWSWLPITLDLSCQLIAELAREDDDAAVAWRDLSSGAVPKARYVTPSTSSEHTRRADLSRADHALALDPRQATILALDEMRRRDASQLEGILMKMDRRVKDECQRAGFRL